MDIGAQLRSAREGLGLSIGTVAERTRVPVKMLAAIERNDQSALPPHPFGRGFVRAYAEEVDLDSDRLVREYFAQFPTPPPVSNHVALSREPVEPSWQPPSRWIGMATAVAILLRRRGGSRSPRPSRRARRRPGRPSARPALRRPRLATGVTATGGVHSGEPRVAASAPAIAQPSAPGVTVVLSVSCACWVAATVGWRTCALPNPAGRRAPHADSRARVDAPVRRRRRRHVDDQRAGRRNAWRQRRGSQRKNHAGKRRDDALRKFEV